MQYRVARYEYAWVRVDWVSVVFYPTVLVTALTIVGYILKSNGIIGGWYAGIYVALAATIANRVCVRAGLLAAALSVLQHDFVFMTPWRFDWPTAELAMTYGAAFVVAYAVGRRVPMVKSPPTDRGQQIETMPFTSSGKSDDGSTMLRSFWEVAPSGDWADDAEVGAAYGRIYIDHLRSLRPTPLLGHVVRDMIRGGRYTGVEAGFMSTLSFAASSKFSPQLLVAQNDADDAQPDTAVIGANCEVGAGPVGHDQVRTDQNA